MTQNRESSGPGRQANVTLTAEIEVPVTLEAESSEARFALVLYSGSNTAVVRLRPNSPVVFGRDFPAQVQLDDPSVSRQHSRFSLLNGAVTVEDLGSRNGTSVNGARITRATALSPGD